MASTKTFAVLEDTVTRQRDDGTSGQGCGLNRRLYAGRSGATGTSRNYDSFIKFDLDWAGVRTIIRATLTLTSDDGLGEQMTHQTALSAPKVIIRRCETAFDVGNNANEVFDASDFTNATTTLVGAKTKAMTKLSNGQNEIDITAIVRSWAPSTVVGGGRKANHGIAVRGTTDARENWAGWAKEAPVPGHRPFITLEYELGPTTPNTPHTLSPSGFGASIVAFVGTFSDPRPTDQLRRTMVDVYTQDAVKSGTSGPDSRLHVADHGFQNGDVIWFHSLTGGSGLGTGTLYYVTDKTLQTFKVRFLHNGAIVPIPDEYSALTVARPLKRYDRAATNTEILNDVSNVLPTGFHPQRGTTYKWRMRQQDQEGRWSPWTALTNFGVNNTDPNAPTITPTSASVDSLVGLIFRVNFSDPDPADDFMLAYEAQLSAFPADDIHWEDASFLLWDTGKQYVPAEQTSAEFNYGGQDLAAGTYYWRARVWDQHDGLSDYTYGTIVLGEDFDAEPGSQDTMQIQPYAPWRIRIREMKFNPVGGAMTAQASTDMFTTASPHGLSAGWKVRFTGLVGGAGLFEGKDYWVIAANLSANQFQVSETYQGTAVNFSGTYTAGNVTTVTTRGPGRTVAILENASSVGGTIVYNSPGEMHFTLPVDHPQISVIEPKQVHYGIDFYTGDGWRETFAGLVDDVDATEDDAVFTGIDYLGLLDFTLDERYFPAEPDRPHTKGGSKYNNQTIRNIIIDQLNLHRRWKDSPVGFITVGSIATMSEAVTIWSTMQPALSFIGGLIDSHRQGTGKKTRIEVRKGTGDTYSFVVTDDPGQVRTNLRMRFGELVQSYRVVAFGREWASRSSSVGRTREGLRVLYKSANAPGIDPHVWGRIARANIVDNVSDEADLTRRTKQQAIKAGKLGSGMAVSIRTGLLRPLDGYNITDVFPIAIQHGAINTDNFGSGFYVCWAVAWEASDDGQQNVVLTFTPREDSVAPDPDLIDTAPISEQPEWQIGWRPPAETPFLLQGGARYFLDQTTGIVYRRDSEASNAVSITGTI